MGNDPVPPKVRERLRAQISESWNELSDDKRALLLRLADHLDEDPLWVLFKELVTQLEGKEEL